VAATATGVAISNPSSTQSANVNLIALDNFGVRRGSTTKIIKPGNHFADTVNSIFGLNAFSGSVQISSDNPLVSLSINTEASPTPQQLVVSSLPPGDLDLSTQLANGSGFGNPVASTFNYTYYFPHFAVSGNWQTVLIYVNYSLDNVRCQTSFMDSTGAALAVPFASNAASGPQAIRFDNITSGGELHDISTADPTKPAVAGWAIGSCTGPVKASMLFRYFPNGITASGEAAVNASTTGTTRFVSFAQSATGLAYANISPGPATVTVVAVDSTGAQRGNSQFNLPAGGHGSQNLSQLLPSLGNFTGSVQIISTQPIVNLEINAEVFPVFSSLPPGDLAPNTPLSTGF